MTEELSNYFRCCQHFSFATRAIASFGGCAWQAVRRRLAPRPWFSAMPPEVRVAREKHLALSSTDSPVFPRQSVAPGKLKLTGCWFQYGGEPDWSVQFADPEVTTSLHRWNWLLSGLTDHDARLTREQGLALMRSWLRNCLADAALSQDAYSTSERVVNGSLFLLLTGDGTVPDDLLAAFRIMARQISAHLEYYEGDLTGNHALNNARGLLFAGAVADVPEAVALAHAIASERLGVLLTPDGFLREGSSHYHFLFTRWVLEMLWLARRHGKEQLLTLLERTARRLVERCWFFLVQGRDADSWAVPLVGDVSPDFVPGWLLCLPWSELAADLYSPGQLPSPPKEAEWAGLFGVRTGAGYQEEREILSFPGSYWHRIERGRLTLFVYAAADLGRIYASHRHFDLCGFILFWDGQAVLIDCGRLDYTGSALSNYGKGTLAHNSFLVNGLGPAVDGPTWLQPAYRTVAVTTYTEEREGATIFSLVHDGFSRIAGGGIDHQRRFVLTDNAFSVEDTLASKRPCDVMLRFHFAPGLELAWHAENELQVAGSLFFHHDMRLRAECLSGGAGNETAGLYFPEYGKTVKCQTLQLAATAMERVDLKNTLFFGDNTTVGCH